MDKMEAGRNEEREKLKMEYAQLEQSIKGDFPNPKDLRRMQKITSLLLTNGASEDLRLKMGKERKSNRVTSFTKDRR